MNASMLRPLPAADARLRELLRTTPSRLQVLDRGAVAAAGATVALALIGRPEREVVAQQLHDERRVLVRLLRERVELRDRVVERLLREMARAVGRREHLVVEDREVEREAEADRVRRRQVGVRDRRCVLVRLERGTRRLLARVRLLELGEVAVVVALHLVVEHLALLARRVRDELPPIIARMSAQISSSSFSILLR